MRALSLMFACALLAAAAGCVGNSICAKRQECNDSLEEDSLAVCVEEYNGAINVLRANSENECHTVADAQLALDACRAQLDCDDFEEIDLGGKCDDELDDLDDARNDVAGDECTARD